MKKEDLSLLDQLVKSLEETASHLEDAYEKKDFNIFDKSKKFMIEIQKKIIEAIE